MMRRALNRIVLASLPNGAGFLEAAGLRDSSESYHGYPVVYTTIGTAILLEEEGVPRGVRCFAGPGFDENTLVRFAGPLWEIDHEGVKANPVGIEYDTREGCLIATCHCHIDPQPLHFTCSHCGCRVVADEADSAIAGRQP